MMKNMNVDGLYQQNLALVNETEDNNELTFSLNDSTITGDNLLGSVGIKYSDDKNNINLVTPLSYDKNSKEYAVNPTLSYTYTIDSLDKKVIDNLNRDLQSYNLLMNHENSINYIKSQILNTLKSIESDKRKLFELENEYNHYLESVEKDTKLGKIVKDNLNDIEANFKINNYKISKNNLESKIERSKANFKLMCSVEYSSSIVDELIKEFKDPEIITSDEYSMIIQSNIKKYRLAKENLNYSKAEELGMKQSITGSINSKIENSGTMYGAGLSYKLNTSNIGLNFKTTFNTDFDKFTPTLTLGAHYTLNKSNTKKIQQSEIEVMNKKIALDSSQRDINKSIIDFNRSVIEYNSKNELLKNKLVKDKAILNNKNKLFEKGLIVESEIKLSKHNVKLDEMDIRLTQIDKESLNLKKQMILISGVK